MPLNDHFMAKGLMPDSSQATLTSRIQHQHEQLKAFEAAAAAGCDNIGSLTGRTLTRTNSQSRYEDRFK